MMICYGHILVILILHGLTETENDFSLVLVVQNSLCFGQLFIKMFSLNQLG